MTSYASASSVFPYFRAELSGSAAFTANTLPTSTDITTWLAQGYARVNRALAGQGYTTPVTSSAACYEEVVQCEILYAAAMGHTVKNVQRASADQWTKGEVYMDRHRKALADLLASDLSRAGLSHTSGVYAGGISDADKESAEEDTDRVTPRFSRGQFNQPGVWPDSGADSSDEG